MQVITGKFEVVAIWEGEIYTHDCPTLEEAFEWAACYTEQKDCAVRIWRV